MRPLLLAGLCAGLVGLSGCSASTESTEVGVRVRLLPLPGPRGIEPEVYPPGGIFFFPRVFSDWYVFDTAIQNLVMVRERDQTERGRDDSLRFKTVDGNDVSVNVTLAWAIDPKRAPYLLQFVGNSTGQVEEKLVRPVARTLIRDVLNQLTSEEYYQAERRFQMAEQARDRLNQVLVPEGIEIQQVLLGEHRFNDTYEQIIRDKKVAEQEAERLVSETEAAAEEMKRDLERAKGTVSRNRETARGTAEKRQLEANAIFFEREREAQSIESEASARAEGLTEKARALGGAGGERMVRLELARALQGKQILFLPAGGGMDMRTTDMNALLQSLGIKSMSQGKAGER